MNISLDRYCDSDSLLHRWNAQDKLLGLGALMLSFSAVQNLSLLPIMVVVTTMLFVASQLPWQLWRDRLKLPGLFLVSMLLWLPFSGETVLAQLGPGVIYLEGVQSLLLLATRFVCILTLGLVLVGTAPFLSLVRALRAWGLPVLLADMMLLSYRYLYEIGAEFRTMRTAMTLRGFRGHQLNRRTLAVLAALAGSLLVRSYETSERVYSAMRLRGYGQLSSQLSSQQLSPQSLRRRSARPVPRRTDEVLLLAIALVLALGFGLSPWLWPGG